ncbi:MAG: mechanosensitive ion channel family protein [candidate division Zixibacteria bacterium]|nr:mechanosensitive ion channel family protein [candidate division Zixibacteria bacterium]NIR64886.1 mechanosensitive ion channel family protein [candidate division Zixibacteria bacterium]NIS46702.1 mechanosensitive ion channel family protein [candidate division Zixibacteria bacterium]NIX56962.1 mechanosensitive ion channel [candidate division Zixibacteria bacterium]NIX80636.1 mechanosensitive ion channel [candidate division Zixibacteria bacterium]
MPENMKDSVKAIAEELDQLASDSVQAAQDTTRGFFESIQNIDPKDWIIAASVVIGGFILGIILEIFIIRGLRRLAKSTKWEWDDVLIGSFKRAFVIWFTIIGLYIALQVTLSFNQVVENTIQKIIVALLILSVTIIVARAAAGFVKLYSRRTEGGIPATSLFSNIASLIILIAGFVIILQNLGVSITPLITALGIGGLAVALALQDTLSNLFAGFQIIVSKQVRAGDFIKLEGGDEGYVTDVKWRNTTIRSLRSTRVFIVPNSKVSTSIVTNYSMPRKHIWIRIYVGVHYESDLDQVEKVAMEVATEVVKDFYPSDFVFKPVVRFKEFGDSAITFSARLPIRQYIDQFKVRSEFIKRLHKRFNEKGIEIPYPIRNIYVRKEGDVGQANEE